MTPSTPSSYDEEPFVCYRRSCKWLLIWGLPGLYVSNSSFASKISLIPFAKAGLVSDTVEQKPNPRGLQPPEVTAGGSSLVKSPSACRAPAWLLLQTQMPGGARAALQVPCSPRKGLRGLLPSSSQSDSPDSPEQETSKPHPLSTEKASGGRRDTNPGSSFWQSQPQEAEVGTSCQGCSASRQRETALMRAQKGEALLRACRLAWLGQALRRNAWTGCPELLREQKAKALTC